ncbi:coiled-coil domain-containing protein 66 isoform X3 [Puntigrus tetrazona]|uniref:coiled-coil domain-containing protein 66 isoform X3 n=1 Tax=Puntigrus tetrazona TaxID=1606681 RepID=UPI001C898F32|nr:coiled-coil domain-containing protein 66 isoform X3 [Puntigrus tetrazona]
MMKNLGDGLLFELENGKPKLVLTQVGAESKSSNKKVSCRISPRNKTHKIINSKQCPLQPDKVEKEKSSKNTAAVSCVGQNSTGGPKRRSSEAVRVQSDSSRNDSVTQQRESMVCLTQAQFQQILSTISSSSSANTHTHTAEPVACSEEYCSETTGPAEELVLDNHGYRHRPSQEKTDRRPLSDEQQSGLFSTFGERERERDKLEARRAQWKRELDEQMALKRQQKTNLKDMKDHSESCEMRLKDMQDTDGVSSRRAAGAESSNCRAPFQNQQELPAAIRSAFIVGEAAPVEDSFSAQRQEQQRRWVQELDKQREEAKLRRQHDKEINSQAEDIELWAIHFDSLHQPSAEGPKHGVTDTSSCLSHRSISGVLSTAWDSLSAFGGDSLGRASVDTTQQNQQRSSYLRTMTALLDPAQIEERERRKLKQLEHQRAIETQVEERRRQKEKEEATRRTQEQEEERRLERERIQLQQQYIKDTERQRLREVVQSRKTEELYLSIQRAQEEACKDKHIQRIRDLAKKGHDVSKLLHSLQEDSISQALSSEDLPGPSALRTAPPPTTSPRKDTAVQTEISPQPENETIISNAAVTFPAPPDKISQRFEEKASEKSHSKQHLREVDTYEPYARSSRVQRQGKRPEWNTQRPSKAFIPASERYPEALQRHREESRRQRQRQLMMLQERSTLPRTPQQDLLHNHKPQAQRIRTSPQAQHQKFLSSVQSENELQEAPVFSAERVPSPAVKTRVQSSYQVTEDTGCPPLLDYVPYVRTDEVYHMDPLAPLSRPLTHEAQQRVNTTPQTTVVSSSSRQATPLVQHPPKSTERQQAILKGLSELRQGLLQRQRELETSLNPVMQTQHRNHLSPFRPV